jgi:hypothetical protein
MHIKTATCFGLFYRPSSGNIVRKTQACIPRSVIYNVLHVSGFSIGLHQAIRYIKHMHICVLCNILSDDSLQKLPKHVAVVIYMIKLLSCSMEENRNIS